MAAVDNTGAAKPAPSATDADADNNIIKRQKYCEWREAKYASVHEYQKVTCCRCHNLHTVDDAGATSNDDAYTCALCSSNMPQCKKCSVPGKPNVRFAFISPSDIKDVSDTEHYLSPDAELGYYYLPTRYHRTDRNPNHKYDVLCCPCCFSLTSCDRCHEYVEDYGIYEDGKLYCEGCFTCEGCDTPFSIGNPWVCQGTCFVMCNGYSCTNVSMRSRFDRYYDTSDYMCENCSKCDRCGRRLNTLDWDCRYCD